MYSESLFNTLYIKIKHKFKKKKIPSEKISNTKNVLLFLARAPTHHSFTFNSQFLYELKHKVNLSKDGCGIFHIWFYLVFIKVYIFVEQKAWTSWLQNIIIPIKIKIIEKTCTVLFPDLKFLSYNKKSGNSVQWYLHELKLPKNWPADKYLLSKYLVFLYLITYLFLLITYLFL